MPFTPILRPAAAVLPGPAPLLAAPVRQQARRGGRASREGGYSVLEAVIVFPVLILLLMFVVQFALLWHGRHVAQAGALDGLRAARGYAATADAGQAGAQNYLKQIAPHLLLSPTVTVERTANTVTVHVTAGVLSIIPLGLTVDESASGPVERFVGPG